MSAQHAISQDFPCLEPVDVDINVGAGRIVVFAEERTSAQVYVDAADAMPGSRSTAENTEVSFNGNTLRVHVPSAKGFRRTGQVRIEIRVPLDSRLRVECASADLETTGRLADVANQSGSGDTHVSLVTATCGIQTGSGDVQADEVGTLNVKTGSGDVSVRTVSAGTIRTASGDVNVRTAIGVIDISTASGDVDLRSASGNEVRISTASGDVEVGVPVGTRVWMDLSTVSGDTTSDLAMTDAPDQGAQLDVHVRTVSGDIRLRRAAA
jgi:DUF4097 and DUF4098 domain-containing protein YvlB